MKKLSEKQKWWRARFAFENRVKGLIANAEQLQKSETALEAEKVVLEIAVRTLQPIIKHTKSLRKTSWLKWKEEVIG